MVSRAYACVRVRAFLRALLSAHHRLCAHAHTPNAGLCAAGTSRPRRSRTGCYGTRPGTVTLITMTSDVEARERLAVTVTDALKRGRVDVRHWGGIHTLGRSAAQ